MKRFLIFLLILFFVNFDILAKQRIAIFDYYFSFDIQKDIKRDLNTLIEKGCKIITVSFTANNKMVVVYDDMEESK